MQIGALVWASVLLVGHSETVASCGCTIAELEGVKKSAAAELDALRKAQAETVTAKEKAVEEMRKALKSAEDAVKVVKSELEETRQRSGGDEKLTKEKEERAKDRKDWEEKQSAWEKEREQLQKSVNSQKEETRLQVEKVAAELKDARGKLVEQATAFERTRQEVTMMASAAAEVRELKEALRKHEGEKERLTSHARELQALSVELQQQLRLAQETLPSWTQAKTLLKNTRHVSQAFAMQLRRRISQIFNADVFEIVSMQLSVWRSKLPAFSTHQARDLIYGIYASPQVIKVAQQGRRILDNRFSAFIESLSQADPSVRHLFPDSFEDRCVCFAYIAALIFFVSSIVSTVFNFLTAPLVDCFSRSRSSKKAGSKKSASLDSKKPASLDTKKKTDDHLETGPKHRVIAHAAK